MKSLTISSLLSVGIFSIAFAAPISTVSAAPYFACHQGYTFQIRSNAARCHRPGAVQARPLKRCLQVRVPIINRSIGTFYKKNHQGRKDMCVGTFRVAGIQQTTAVNINCPNGYNKKIKPQKDTCEKTVRSQNIAPTKAVSR